MDEKWDLCKGCSESVEVSPDSIAQMVAQVERSGQAVEDEVYNRRLGKCLDCSYLEYGTTCMLCGCIVQVKAKYRTGSCPHPQQSRWDE